MHQAAFRGSEHMPTTILTIAVFVAAAAVLLSIFLKLALSGKSSTTTRLRYKRIDLFNSTEHAFLMALRREAPQHIAVLAKVRVADILSTIGNDIAASNRIQRKHVDFVLYNLQNRSVLRAIELDGPTHTSQRAVKSDNVKNSSFASARIPLTRVLVADADNRETIRSLFDPPAGVEGAYDQRGGGDSSSHPTPLPHGMTASRPAQSSGHRRPPNRNERR
jgi:hypothetical protein